MIASETSIAQLHEILQPVFDWSGEHMLRFRIHGRDYGISQLGGLVFDEDAWQVPLSVSSCIAESAFAINTTS